MATLGRCDRHLHAARHRVMSESALTGCLLSIADSRLRGEKPTRGT